MPLTADETFRLLVSSIRDYAIFMLDTEGRVATWNEGAERIKGYRADEIIGEHYRRFFTPEDVEGGEPERLLVMARRDGRAEHEGWRIRKDGSRFLAHAVITKLVDGPDAGFVKVTRDITETMQAREAERERAAREQTQALLERIRAFATNIPGLAYRRVLHPDGTVSYPFVHGRYVELLGLSLESIAQGRADLLAVTHPDDLGAVRELMERSARDLTPAEVELRMVLPSGEVRWMHSRSLPQRRPDGSTVWDAVAFDVTERHRAEERLRLLQSTSLAVAEAEDFNAALTVVLREVCAATGWDYGEAWSPDHSGIRMALGPVWHRSHADLAALREFSRAISFAKGEGVIGIAWQTRQFRWVPDLTAWPGAHPARVRTALAAGIRTVCVAPISAENEVLAIMSFAMFERREHDAGLAATISAVASQLGLALWRKRAEQAFRESEERLDRAQEIAGIGSWELDIATGRYVWSRQMYRILGLDPNALDPTIESFMARVHGDDSQRVQEWRAGLLRGTGGAAAEFRIRRPDGETRIVNIEGAASRDDRGDVKLIGTMQDVTDAHSAQRQLVQAQKMEAIGNLTGGMAHDFNNLLGIVIGNLDLLHDELEPGSEVDELAREALEAALRGADLVRRLLAFARRQPLLPERIDLAAQIGEIAKLLARTLGEDIEIALDFAADTWPVTADPAQLEAAITNLVNNARDAMPRGGKLTITVGRRHLDEEYATLHPEVAPGDYAVIEVSDTGTGMPPEVLNRIFEPFFTTKEQGKGSGLGLSMVFGFMKQSGGHVSVYSEPGRGTTLRLYLPRALESVEPARRPSPPATIPGGHEQILLVEDNARLRRVLAKLLTDLGYPVLETDNARAALELLEAHETIRLLFTDVVMPGEMSGIDLARAATARWPRLKVLLTSGFPEPQVRRGNSSGAGFPLLSKPYRKEVVARILRQILDGGMA